MGATLEEVQGRIAALGQDREHGAGFLAAEALRILALAAEACPRERSLLPYLRQVGQRLSSSRPTMVAVENAVTRFLEEVERLRADKGKALAISAELLHCLEQASTEAARQAANLLPSPVTVITCSYSAMVTRTCMTAVALGKGLHVLAMESRAGGINYGGRMSEELAAGGIPVEVAPDDVIGQAVVRADLALVGADRVFPDGAIVNGAPTLRLAQAAHGRVPLYVVCESIKSSALTHTPPLEPGFDLVPAELVHAIVTEQGAVTPVELRERWRVMGDNDF